MNKLLQRLLTFFIGIPLIIFIVYIPNANHIVLNIIIVLVSIISSIESYNLMKFQNPVQPKILVICLSSLIPISALICTLTGMDFMLTTFVFVISFMLLMTMEIFIPTSKDNEPYKDSNIKLANSLFVLFYGGFLLTFLSRMTIMENATEYIIVLLMMVFICDSFAWLFGMCFGKNNRGLIKASPNKSIAGFFGGFLGSILSGLLGKFLWPNIFHGNLIRMIILGVLIACASILGDLAESVFKRSAKVKDSGKIIPGRGGILDSIDSILMATPVFYFYIILIFE